MILLSEILGERNMIITWMSVLSISLVIHRLYIEALIDLKPIASFIVIFLVYIWEMTPFVIFGKYSWIVELIFCISGIIYLLIS